MATIAMSFLRYLSLLALGAITALGIAVESALSAEAHPARPEFTLPASPPKPLLADLRARSEFSALRPAGGMSADAFRRLPGRAT